MRLLQSVPRSGWAGQHHLAVPGFDEVAAGAVKGALSANDQVLAAVRELRHAAANGKWLEHLAITRFSKPHLAACFRKLDAARFALNELGAAAGDAAAQARARSERGGTDARSADCPLRAEPASTPRNMIDGSWPERRQFGLNCLQSYPWPPVVTNSKASLQNTGLYSRQAPQEPQGLRPRRACARPKPFQLTEPGAYRDTRPAAVAATADATPSRVRFPSRFT